ncbi:MAG: Ig-like domain-containing protein [Ruminococcus sp.]
MKKTLSIISICLAFLVASFSAVFAVDNDELQNNVEIKNNTVPVMSEPVMVDTPEELQELSPTTNFTVAKLGQVGEYSLYYNVTEYYQYLDYNVIIGEYVFDCFAQQEPSDLGLYIVGNGKAYALADAYQRLKINMDTVYELIKCNDIQYNFTVERSVPTTVTEPTEYHNVYYYLRGATSTNKATIAGDHYNTVIKPEIPYEIDYIVVTVNNKERTVSKNADGSYTVDLDNIDGDINIFVSATFEKAPNTSVVAYGCEVKYDLNNVTSSNMTNDAWMNYRTVITPKTGYVITNISATINGKNVGKITKKNGTYEIFVEYIQGPLLIKADAKSVKIDTPNELEKLYPNRILSVANLGKVGNYNLYYQISDYYQFLNKDIRIGNYMFNCYQQEMPYDLGLYIVGNGKAYTLKDDYDKLNINMDEVYSLINKTDLHYNFTVTKVAQEKLSATNVCLKSGAVKTIKVLNGKVKSYKVANNKVAKVDSKGVITGLNKGKTTVIATLKDGNKLNCKVNVTTEPKLSKTVVTVNEGKTAVVKLSGKVSTIDNKYTNTKIAKINSKVSTSILKIKGIKKGETTLKIKVNGVKTLSLKVKVK